MLMLHRWFEQVYLLEAVGRRERLRGWGKVKLPILELVSDHQGLLSERYIQVGSSWLESISISIFKKTEGGSHQSILISHEPECCSPNEKGH